MQETTNYTDQDKLKALAIVNIFETSKPMGDYAAVTVLNDGAGISYGINQFTHRSGSLAAVVETYLNSGGRIGREVLSTRLAVLRLNTSHAIAGLISDQAFKNALRASAITREMKDAQIHVAFERYLRPAIRICERRGFILPLSLAVVYDSIVQGSFERIAAATDGVIGGEHEQEKAWVTAYVHRRHSWLTNIDRLKTTNYRTKFFLDQIVAGDWELQLPLNVHGVRLTAHMLEMREQPIEPLPEVIAQGPDAALAVQAEPGSSGWTIDAATARFDSVDNVVETFLSRKDAAKSLWTTVFGTVWQMAWAVFGFFTGLPREVWIIVAIIAAALMLLYLWRQLELGRIREQQTRQK
jgi:chitosanase